MALLRRRPALALLLAVFFAIPGNARAQAAEEYELKAAFLYNFAKFVDWPPAAFPDPNASFRICVLGKDPFGGSLQDAVGGEEIAGHKLIVVRTNFLPKPAGCQILFISRSERDQTAQILLAVKDSPVLTVGDSPGFLEQGGVINFLLEGTKVRFEINNEAAVRARLTISSKLLQLARRVVANPGVRPGA
jgi:hypothetical protein